MCVHVAYPLLQKKSFFFLFFFQDVKAGGGGVVFFPTRIGKKLHMYVCVADKKDDQEGGKNADGQQAITKKSMRRIKIS